MTLRVVFVVYQGIQPLDVVGPHEVFAGANAYEQARGRPARYDLSVVAPGDATVRSPSGLLLAATPELPEGPIDTIVVAGGEGSRQVRYDPGLLRWLRDAAGRTRRTCSVCSGTFVLAAAGLLDGRRVTTHWSAALELGAEYPRLTVDADPLFLNDGPIWTSAGVTAGMDLALALVEADLGAAVARTVARHLVLFQRRSGGQSQFAGEVWTDPVEREALRDLIHHIHERPDGDLRLPALAERAAMSVRHLQRVFVEEVGEPPSVYVTRVRVDAARRLLTLRSEPLTRIARRCGFGTTEAMRRAFHRHVGVSPDAYRDRFRPALTPL